jgi:hypothetical protein
MADNRRGEVKQAKKDQQVQREVRSDINAEVASPAASGPQYRNPNRDQARGDWDRTGRRTDEDRSRDEGNPGDDGLRPPGRG